MNEIAWNTKTLDLTNRTFLTIERRAQQIKLNLKRLRRPTTLFAPSTAFVNALLVNVLTQKTMVV